MFRPMYSPENVPVPAGIVCGRAAESPGDSIADTGGGIIRNRLFIGDNRKVLPYLVGSGETFDVIYLDPPYNGYVMRGGRSEPETDESVWLADLREVVVSAAALLKDTGLLFISINDSEAARCRILCDEVMGRHNFMAQIVRRRSDGSREAHVFMRVHEYIIVFAKDAVLFHSGWDRPPVSTWWDSVGTDEDAAAEICDCFGTVVFDHAKPSAMICKCIEMCGNTDARILDAYAGSGTTAQAVETLNAADYGRRTYTLIQHSEAYNGYDIAEICRARAAKIIERSDTPQICEVFTM